MFYYKRIVYHVQHFNDTCRTDIAFCNSGIERITSQIVKSVHVQLTGYQLMKKILSILTFEDRNGKIQLPVEVIVYLLHHHQRDLFMGDSKYEEIAEVYDETQPGDEVPYDYLYLSVNLEPNEDTDYGEYQYKASLTEFYYDENGYCIALAECDEDEHCYVVAKTQSTVPANTLEFVSVTDGDNTIVAQYNRPLNTNNSDKDVEDVSSCTTAREVGTDVTEDPNVVHIFDQLPYGNGVEIPKNSFEPGDLYIITTVKTWSDEANDNVDIVTTCSEKIVIPGTPEE